MRNMTSKGMAIVVALITITVLAALGSIMVSRSVGNLKAGQDNTAVARALMLARGGAAAGGSLLVNQMQSDLNSIVTRTDTSLGGADTGTTWAYGGSGTSPDLTQVVSRLATVAAQAQIKADALTFNINYAPDGVTATVNIRIYFTSTACGQALPGNSGGNTVLSLPSGRMALDKDSIAANATSFNPAQQIYAVPYIMVAEASVGSNYKRNVVIQGEYLVSIGGQNFAYYSLFTNRHKNVAGSAIWFTDKTLFDGPVHTNENFRFQFNPWFGGQVTSAGCLDGSQGATYCANSTNRRYGAYFNGSSSFTSTTAMSPNATAPVVGSTAPVFAGSPAVNWQRSYISMPPNNVNMQAQAVGTSGSTSRGIYFPGDVNSVTLTAGDSDCDPLSQSGGAWTPSATFQCIEAVEMVTTTVAANTPKWVCTRTRRGRCRAGYWTTTTTTTTVTNPVTTRYRYASDNILYKQNATTSVWEKQTNAAGDIVFNGMIFANGDINSISGPTRTDSSDPSTAPPAIASFAKITLANVGTSDNMQIDGDLKYENPPCSGSLNRSGSTINRATCNNLSAQNVLGLYSQNGNIYIASGDNNSLQNLTINAVLMTPSGETTVENYSTIDPKGNINLLGGIIENTYGGFGTFNSSTGSPATGYGRQFTYDPRMQSISPPFFPSTQDYRVSTATPYMFGQREQIY